MIAKVIFLNILLLVFSACSTKHTPLSSIDKHIVITNELNILMQELDMVVYDEYKSELERDDMRRRYAITLADNIKELIININQIPKNKLGEKIDIKNQKTFYTYLRELERSAKEIDSIAQNYELEKLDSKINYMKNVCDNCHLKLRKY
ncbi:hypothetical protein [Sulfurimonas sp.]